MPGKNIRGGRNFKKKSSGRARRVASPSKIDVDAGEGYYAKVKKIMGNNKVMLCLHNGKEEIGTIPGRMLNKVWLRPGFIVLTDKDKRIEELIVPGSIREEDAKNKLGLATNETIIFGNSAETDYEETVDDQLQFISNDKSSSIPSREIQKEKNILRNKDQEEGRHFTDQKILEQQIINTIDEESESDSDIDIDDL